MIIADLDLNILLLLQAVPGRTLGLGATPGPVGRRKRGEGKDLAKGYFDISTMSRVEATMATIQSELRGKEAVNKEEGARKLRKKIKDKEVEIEELDKLLILGKDTKDKETRDGKDKKRVRRKQEKKDGTRTAVAAFETLEKQLEGRRRELEERKREISSLARKSG